MTQELIELRNTNFYLILNKQTKKSISISHLSKNYEEETLSLESPSQENLGQVWMLVEVAPDRFPNKYEVVHTVSTLALTAESNSMSLKPGKWKSNQLYFLQRHNPKIAPNEFWIRQDKDSNKYLAVENENVIMKDMMISSENCIWELILVHRNPIINRSCYIEYAYSSMVLDVPEASDKPGIDICQYPCNNRFNQRWNLIKEGEYWKIENLKTKLFLDIKGATKKPGAHVVQWKATDGINQLWKIDNQGKNIYFIRSALDSNLFLGVKDNSLKECAGIVTTNNESECFWRIVGFVPQ